MKNHYVLTNITQDFTDTEKVKGCANLGTKPIKVFEKHDHDLPTFAELYAAAQAGYQLVLVDIKDNGSELYAWANMIHPNMIQFHYVGYTMITGEATNIVESIVVNDSDHWWIYKSYNAVDETSEFDNAAEE